MVPILVDIVDVDTDAPVVAAANPRAHVRCVTADTDHRNRRRLRNEDEVALGVGRHRVRAGRLRDGLDQDAGSVDHAEHGRLGRRSGTGSRCFAIPVGARVVALVALVEPDFIRADDAVDVGKVLVTRIDDQRAPVGWIVGRSAAQQQIVMWSNSGTVGSAVAELQDAGVRVRVERSEHRSGSARRLVGSITISPPSQVAVPHPPGFPRIGTDT